MNYIRIMFAYTPAIASSWIDTTHAHYSVVTICWMTALKKFKFFAWNFQSLSFRMQIMRSCEPRGQMQIGYTNIAINRRVFWQGALFRRQNSHFFFAFLMFASHVTTSELRLKSLFLPQERGIMWWEKVMFNCLSPLVDWPTRKRTTCQPRNFKIFSVRIFSRVFAHKTTRAAT